ncbi:MAG: Asp/Glu/hydantoin racemase, partial [Burkholderiales bacterium]
LADARVDVIGWSGTAAGWLGFESDRRLCERIEARTGIAATTSVLAVNELLEKLGCRRFGLVTPYRGDVQQRIIENYAEAGYQCVAERHLDISVNFAFAEVEPERIEAMCREVASARPQAITTFCTNLRAAQLADSLERETGVMMLDTVSTVVWKMLRISGVDATPLARWGRLFGVR